MTPSQLPEDTTCSRSLSWWVLVGFTGCLGLGCGDNAPSLQCGEGTHQEGNECVPDSINPDDTNTATDSGDSSTDPTDPIDPNKSPKRGLAYNLIDAEDFTAISSGVSWWYNWYFQTGAPSDAADVNSMTFIPMLWGYNSESDYLALETWLLSHPETSDVLVMNEPNLTNQANMTPTAAVQHWIRYERFQADMLAEHGRKIRLIGPAMTWGNMSNYGDPVVWLTDFYSAFNAAEGRDPIIDALAFHWYDYGLDEQLTRLEGFGKPFWVTEMANWHTASDWTIDTPEKQMETMIDMVSICESRADVERYAWFIGRWDPDPHYTSLFEPEPGELTELGKAYLEQPW